ncbi:hypothetical protein [Leucobacter musarum]|uniref:hypothetical protein n=1 Tax=Leucobacter musarum TaxID=1930747 RepID=UPI0006A7C084|nr:hypothetical protein [Leucobacter musarum]
MTAVTTLVTETVTLFAECDASTQDPTLEEAWALVVDVSQLSGARLMEPRFGGLTQAADEVALYLGQFDRVSRITRDAPFRVPATALRPLKAAGRFVENTDSIDEVCALLLALPHIAAAYLAYLERTGGRYALPLTDLMKLAVRAGSVYRDSFTRTIPAV